MRKNIFISYALKLTQAYSTLVVLVMLLIIIIIIIMYFQFIKSIHTNTADIDKTSHYGT